MHIELLLQCAVVLMLVNGAPIVVWWIFGDRGAWPVDAELSLGDGRRVFGSSKTVRGVVAALIAGGAGGWLLGLSWQVGLKMAFYAMVGDLLSSFIKRRLGLAASDRAWILDQVPESLLPLLAVGSSLGLGWLDIALVVTAFTAFDLAISRVLFSLKLRKRPY